MTDKRKLLAEAILPLIELDARDFFDNYATGKGHVARRWNVLKEALSPADPMQGRRVTRTFEGGQEIESDWEKLPLFNSEELQANYDDAKGKALIERGLCTTCGATALPLLHQTETRPRRRRDDVKERVFICTQEVYGGP